MADQVGNAVPVPGQFDEGSVTDSELLYSTSGYTQKGVTLAGGQGILYAGTVLGRVSDSKKWAQYDNSANDGTEVARGVLRKTTDTGTGETSQDVQANIVIRGILKNALISGADANALTDLNARQDTVLGTFTF